MFERNHPLGRLWLMKLAGHVERSLCRLANSTPRIIPPAVEEPGSFTEGVCVHVGVGYRLTRREWVVGGAYHLYLAGVDSFYGERGLM